MGIDFNKLRAMNDYRERVNGGEDIFGEIEDVYLNNFIKDMALISAPTEDFTGNFHDIVNGLREKDRVIKIDILRKYFIQHENAVFDLCTNTLTIGDTLYTLI